jgi:hypothetical protein
MMPVLLIYAAASSYWYFWQVLLDAGDAPPADVARCALFGLLTGWVLVTVALIVVLASSGQSAFAIQRMRAYRDCDLKPEAGDEC